MGVWRTYPRFQLKSRQDDTKNKAQMAGAVAGVFSNIEAMQCSFNGLSVACEGTPRPENGTLVTVLSCNGSLARDSDGSLRLCSS